jgi:hypothetical protein
VRTDSRDWLDGLREFATDHRDRRPLADITRPTPGQAAERMILAADLATQLPAIDALLAARSDWRRHSATDRDLDPAIVVTTSAVGIAAVAELLASPTHGLHPLANRLAAVTELEYRLWCIRRPDDAYRLHITLWSWIKTHLPEQRWAEFASHPLGPGEAYWLHRTGVAGVGTADCRHGHLWKWNGRHAALLEPFVRERSVARLDRPAGGDEGRD